MTTKFLGVRTAPHKAKLLRELVQECKVASISDGLDMGLTMLLERYGKLGARPAEPQSGPQKAEAAVKEG